MALGDTDYSFISESTMGRKGIEGFLRKSLGFKGSLVGYYRRYVLEGSGLEIRHPNMKEGYLIVWDGEVNKILLGKSGILIDNGFGVSLGSYVDSSDHLDSGLGAMKFMRREDA